ncbi:MAG: hypothetical protein GKR94_28055 [Gammaproteobacteria bacterium]|nr:hypothetical protein [Gammaproteobacteria bacterium]
MSLIARHLEGLGTPTLCLASALDIVTAGQPPRAVFLDYPLGHTTGKPFDRADQLDVVRQALNAFEGIREASTIAHLPNRWANDDSWRQTAMHPTGSDTRQPRDTTPMYQTEADRLLAEGA